MENTANKAQKYLLNNNCGDLILNDHRTTKPEDRIYASDIMMMFLESERGQNVDTGKSNCTIFDVSNSLPDDVPLFVDWLDKYYTHAGNDDLYKRKDNGKIEPQRKLYNDYKRAYKLGNDC